MAFKKHLFKTFCILTSLSLIGCGKGRKNINMVTENDDTPMLKWDTFAQRLGLPITSEEASLDDMEALKAQLITPPANFTPKKDANGDEVNTKEYELVKEQVEKFVLNQAQSRMASKVISIVPFNSTILGEDSLDHSDDPNFISLSYRERGAENATTFEDLSNYKTNSGLNKDGAFSLNPTVNAKVVKGAPITGKVYVVTYQLFDKDDEIFTALITVPDSALGPNASAVPLLMYTHGGDAGLTFKELAKMLQSNLGKFVVAAPAYPGEPICAVSFTEGESENNYQRNCVDHNGQPAKPAIQPYGKKSPIVEDVSALLGLQNAIKGLTTKDLIPENNFNPLINSYDKAVVNYRHAMGIASSRGGATLLASIGRTGILLSIKEKCKKPENLDTPICLLFKEQGKSFKLNQKKLHMKETDLFNEDNFSMLSAAGFYYSPSSLLVGQFRFLTKYMVTGNVPLTLHALPMIPELKNYFNKYIKAPIGSAEEDEELNKLIGFMGASDMTYIAPYISVAVQNWTTNLPSRIGEMNRFMPGSVVFIHGTQDGVVPFTESLISQKAMDAVFENIYTSSANKDDKNYSPLVDGMITPVGSQFYSFQPDERYYNIPAGTTVNYKECVADENAVNFNTDKKMCFGGGYLNNGESNSDHGMDPAFLTSRVENNTLRFQNVGSEILRNAFLFGIDPNADPVRCDPNSNLPCSSVYSFYKQFQEINKGAEKPFSINEKYDCSDLSTKNPYCYSLGFTAIDKAFKSYPLYYRSLGQDQTMLYKNALLGTWSQQTQENSQLTPTDVLTSWIDNSVLDNEYGVFKFYNIFTPMF